MTKRLLFSLALACLLIVAVVLAPAGGDWLWLRTLHDFAHGPIFGLVAITALLALREIRQESSTSFEYPLAFAIAVALGGLTEIAQIGTGRDASWLDFATDSLGAFTFLLVYSVFDVRARQAARPPRLGIAAAAALCLLLLISPLISTAAAYVARARTFPIVFDAEGGVGLHFLTKRQVLTRIELLPERWSVDEEHALLVGFLPGQWQGIYVEEVLPDWRDYSVLAVDLVNPTSKSLKVVVRVDDGKHNWKYADRYNGEFTVLPHSRSTLRIATSSIRKAPRDRELDLRDIERLCVFRQSSSEAASMYVVSMRLERPHRAGTKRQKIVT